ncbi:hypothetical protein Tco_1303962 [Tanacetum coccineum]
MAKAKHSKLSSNFKKATEQKFKEYDSKLEALSKNNVPEAIEEFVQAKVTTKIKKQMPTNVPKYVANFVKPRLDKTVLKVMKNNQIKLFTSFSITTADLSEIELKIELYNRMYRNHSFETHDTLWDSILLDQEILDAQETEPTLKKMPHDDQDPPNDREGEKRRKRRRNVIESSSKSSNKDKAPIDSTNDDIPMDVAKERKSNWFDMLLKSKIDHDEDSILGLSIVMVVKKFKEVIKNEELTIADQKGTRFEMLKSCYKNDVELEYHMSKSARLDSHFYNSDFYYIACLSMEKKYTSSLTKHYAARYYIEGIEDTISNRWSKEIHKYHVDALYGIHHWKDKRKYFFKAEMGYRSAHKVYYDKKIITVVSVNVKKKWGYRFLSSIKVKRIDGKEYEFRIDHKIPYMTTGTEKAVVYLNKYDVISLMPREEVYKFCYGTLVKV